MVVGSRRNWGRVGYAAIRVGPTEGQQRGAGTHGLPLRPPSGRLSATNGSPLAHVQEGPHHGITGQDGSYLAKLLLSKVPHGASKVFTHWMTTEGL
jgi:hypothetical protein